MTKVRRVELGQLLVERRRQIRQDVQNRKREGRADRSADVGDIGETAEAAAQEGIEFALLQSQSQALERVDEALVRIDAGEYGICIECHIEIPEQRLRALPFAVRCTTCQEQHEQITAREHRGTRGHEAASLFAHVTSSDY